MKLPHVCRTQSEPCPLSHLDQVVLLFWISISSRVQWYFMNYQPSRTMWEGQWKYSYFQDTLGGKAGGSSDCSNSSRKGRIGIDNYDLKQYQKKIRHCHLVSVAFGDRIILFFFLLFSIKFSRMRILFILIFFNFKGSLRKIIMLLGKIKSYCSFE